MLYCNCKVCVNCFKKEYKLRIDTDIYHLIELRRFSCLACPRPDCLKNEKIIIDTHLKNLSKLVSIVNILLIFTILIE